MIIMRRVILLVFLSVVPSLLGALSAGACSSPSTKTITYTWPPSGLVQVLLNTTPSAPVTTAMSNWNNTFLAAGTCFAPKLVTTSGSETIIMLYDTLATDGCTAPCVTRGLTHLETASFSGGRLKLVTIEINSGITAAAAITEVVAHEIGHTYSLNDCNYPACPINSTVMENDAPMASLNGVVGAPGPTGCDLASVLGLATDYLCPIPPPPPHCGRILVCNEGYAFNYTDCQCEAATPIVIDLSGKGFDLTDAAGGVLFDISGSGHPMQMGWTASGANNAFLALPAADGLVHNGKQLFGNATPQPASDAPNGFAALAVYDDPKNGGNGDGVIDSQDAIFSSLRLWIDENHDGICQPGELHTLPSLGVDSISLDYHDSRHKDENGNLFRYKDRLNPDDPDVSHIGRIAYDVFFVVATDSATAKNVPTKLVPSETTYKCKVPTPQEAVLSSAGKF